MIDATFNDVFLADFGMDASSGSSTGKVLFDQPDNTAFGDMVQTTEYTATLRVIDFPVLVAGNTLTISGTAYVVREVVHLEDGAFARATLSKP